MTDGAPLVNRRWLLARRPSGKLKLSDFEQQASSFEVPTLDVGEVVLRNDAFLCSPVMRKFMDPPSPTNRFSIPLGSAPSSATGAEVVASNNPDLPVGALVQGSSPWEDYTVLDRKAAAALVKVAPGDTLHDLLGPLSTNGLTAYFGLFDVGKIAAGETVVVSAAAGSVGVMACQIARIAGCRVIGIAGGEDKRDWLVEHLGVEAAIDYKSEDVAARLRSLCPRGIDVYFDNVGGGILQAAMDNIADRGRVVVCGQVSADDGGSAPGIADMMKVVYWRVRIEGFRVADYAPRFDEARTRLRQWLASGELMSVVDVRSGFEQLPVAFMALFEGGNRGSLVVDISGDRRSQI